MTQFEIWINNTLIDVKDDVAVSVTNSIADIMQPDTRQTAYTKTIVIPGSKANRELFDYIFELSAYIDSSGGVNFNPDFNPNLKASAVMLIDTVEFFSGIAQLTKVNIIDNENIEFEIVLTGQLTNLFKNIGDAELIDLDLSDYDHDFTDTSIVASWTNTYADGYVYPLIDYGFSSDLEYFNTTAFRPAVFVKNIIDKIFSDAGCTYESAFFDGSFFESLIMPFSGSNFKITSSDIADRLFRAERTSNQTFSVANLGTDSVVKFNDDSTPPNFDASSQYVPASGVFTVASNLGGTFNFSTYIKITTTWTPDTPAIAMKTTVGTVVNISFIKQDASGNNTVLNSTQRIMVCNGANTVTTTQESDPDDQSYYYGMGDGNIYLQSGAITLIPTDKVFVLASYAYSFHSVLGGSNWNPSALPGIFIDGSNNYYDGTIDVNIKADSYVFNQIANADYTEGQTINMNSVLPEKVKQKDFLMSIIKMFNLYIEQDTDVTNKFIIEPREDYYYDGSLDSHILDLTSKLDISQSLEIEPMGALDFKRYRFAYKEDKDYFNTDYLNRWGETYSERVVDVDNDFIVNEKKTDVIFSATPSVGNGSSDRIIPRILNIDLSGVSSPVSANPRILQWGGLKNTNNPFYIRYGGVDTAYTQYPYAGMLDDPFDPTVSLDWEVPDEIYWTNIFHDINYTNKNLYNQYWKQFIEEITDANSKIVRGWFDIRPYDYVRLDFRKLYYFENEYFRLNKIYDYNPLNNALTKLEFIRVKRGLTPSFNITEADNYPQDDLSPAFVSPDTQGGNTFQLGATPMIKGERNRVANNVISYMVSGNDNMIGEWARNIMINGDGNAVAGDSSGVVVIGDNNIILGSNVTLINTSNKRIDQNDCTVINGRIVSGVGTVEYITVSKTLTTDGNDDASVFLCDCTSGDLTFNLPVALDFGIGNQLTIKKTDSSANTVTIVPDGSETIHGDVSLILTSQWDSPRLLSDGANWYII